MTQPFKNMTNEELASALGFATLQGHLVFTIDRGGDANDCFYRVNAVSLRHFAFKEQKIVLWADGVQLWGDAPREEPSLQ